MGSFALVLSLVSSRDSIVFECDRLHHDQRVLKESIDVAEVSCLCSHVGFEILKLFVDESNDALMPHLVLI